MLGLPAGVWLRKHGSWWQGLSSCTPSLGLPSLRLAPEWRSCGIHLESRQIRKPGEAGQVREEGGSKDGLSPERNLPGEAASCSPYATSPTAARWQDEALTLMGEGGGKDGCLVLGPPPTKSYMYLPRSPLLSSPTSLLPPASGRCLPKGPPTHSPPGPGASIGPCAKRDSGTTPLKALTGAQLPPRASSTVYSLPTSHPSTALPAVSLRGLESPPSGTAATHRGLPCEGHPFSPRAQDWGP